MFPHEDRPGLGPDKADHHVESGGLAGAVWPEQADDLSLLDLDRDFIDGDFIAVVFYQLVSFDVNWISSSSFL